MSNMQVIVRVGTRRINILGKVVYLNNTVTKAHKIRNFVCFTLKINNFVVFAQNIFWEFL